MKAKIILAGVFMALSVTAFSQYTRNDNQNSNPYARAYQRIDAGNSYTIELRNGELWSCGTNSSGQLGIGNTTNQVTPTQIGTDNNWQVFSTGLTHAHAIKADGTLWGWGLSGSGAIGDGATTNRNAPVQIGTDNKWVMVSAGNGFSIGLKSDGTLWAWGVNASGQLGIGSITAQTSPVQIGSSTDWKYINCGYSQAFAIKANGTLWSWGGDTYGILGNGAITGTITSPAQIGTDNTWLKVSCKFYHVLGLKTTGELYGWGHNGHGQLGLGNTTNQPSPALIGSSGYQNISVGEGFSYAIKYGQLFACGNNAHGQLSQGNTTNLSTFTAVGTNTNVVAMAGSNGFGAVLYANSDLSLTGRNNAGQFGTGNTTNSLSLTYRSSNTAGWLHVELHYNSSYALKQDGTIWSWGNAYTSTPAQLGTDNDWISIVGQGNPGSSERFFGLKADGTLWRYDGTNFNLTSSTTYRSIYSSQLSPVYAITTDGNLYTFTTSNTGTLLSNSGDWVRANGGGLSGNTFTVGLKNDGTVWVTGTNNYQGIYGNGTTTTVAGFNQTTISNVIGISSSNFSAFAIKSDGNAMAWGGNQFGDLHIGSGATYSSNPASMTNGTNIIKFDSEEEGYCFAIKGNGTLWCCGAYIGDGNGSSNIASLTQHATATDVVAVAKGRSHGSIVKAQRSTLCLTGSNTAGQLGDGTTTNNYNFDCASVVAIKPPKQTHANSVQKDLKFSENNTFDVYPVPSTGIVNMKATDDSDIQSVEVIDLQGTIVYRLSNNRINEIDLSNLPKGSYFIRMYTKTQSENRKIILM